MKNKKNKTKTTGIVFSVNLNGHQEEVLSK
jgi:hypothetical protein